MTCRVPNLVQDKQSQKTCWQEAEEAEEAAAAAEEDDVCHRVITRRRLLNLVLG